MSSRKYILRQCARCGERRQFLNIGGEYECRACGLWHDGAKEMPRAGRVIPAFKESEEL
jgi:hypothetical protein